MATISTRIELQDGVSQSFYSMANAAQSFANDLNDINNTSIDLDFSQSHSQISSLAAQLQDLETMQNQLQGNASNMYIVPRNTRNDIQELNSEIQRAKAALEQAASEGLDIDAETSLLQLEAVQDAIDGIITRQAALNEQITTSPFQMPTQSQPQSPEPIQPVQWNSNNFDVFSTTGIERYEQEMQSLNTYMQQLYGTQQQISQQAQRTDLFPDNMVADLTNLQGKIEAIRAKVQQIERNPLNVGSETANAQLEQLRSQLHQMVDEQNDLNAAVENMDVSAANSAYQRLNSTVQNTETFIRDNTNAQGQFTNAIQQSETMASNLMKKVAGIVAAYASIQSIKMVIDVSDTLTQTTARLDMMNDGLQTTEQLQNMIFQAAERSRGSYQASADAISKMGIMARDAFDSNQELIGFVEQLNKQFTIAGTSAEGINAAMLQLTQAMGSGVLRGEELNSVFEQAPTIIQAIADYMEVPIGQIRAMAQEGQLSATVVKNALLSAAEETNAKFEQMPKTFGQIWTSIQNKALMAFQPILKRLNQIANSEAFTTFVNNAVNALSVLASWLTNILNIVLRVGKFFADNWSIIAPIVYGIAAAMAVYTVALIANNIVQAINNALKGQAGIVAKTHAAALMMEQGATFAATAAQYGFNAALLACPITWIIIAIIAVIALIYVVIGVINQVCDTSISATGIIVGTIATIGAYLFNQIVFWWNIISAFIEFFVNVWKNPEYAIKAFIVNVVNAFLGFYMAIVQGNGAAIGVIVGAWYAFCQIIYNIVTIIYNAFCTVIEWIVNAWNQCVFAVQTVLYNIANAAFDVAEGAASAFDAAASAIANAFISAANVAIDAINAIIGALNAVPGVNIGTVGKIGAVSFSGASNAVSAARSHLSAPSAPETFTLDRMELGSIGDAYAMGNQAGQDFAAGFEGTVSDIQAGMQDWLGEKPEDYWEAPKLDYINLGDAAKAGYNFGAGVEDKLSNFGLDEGLGDISDIQNTLNDIAGNTGDGAGSGGDTADNTGKMADALDCTDEELKYLRDIAERDVINRFTTAELKVEFHNENNINSDLDIDGIVDELTERTKEELEAVAEGVYS